MKVRALLVGAVLCLIAVAPAAAKVKTPKSPNANVKHANRKAKKFKPGKYKAQKLSKKPPKSARVKTGVVKHT
jgi:hypothetical protein